MPLTVGFGQRSMIRMSMKDQLKALVLLDEQALRRHAWWLLLVLACLTLLPGMDLLPMVDRDEPRFAEATQEMINRENAFIPYFNGHYRFDKPPLTYWWMAIHYGLLGRSEFAARLHSAISAYLVALVILALGRRIFGIKAGFFAAGAWLTCLQVFIHGRLALADMPMILAVALSMWALYELLTREEAPPRYSRWYWQLWLAQAMGFLAKGPIALAVPLLALLLWRWVFYRRPLPWKRLQAATGLPLALLPIAAWGIPALLMTHGQFWEVGMGKHVIERGTSSFNERFVLPFYYLGTAFFSLFPWIALLGLAWHRMRRDWGPANSFLLAWFLAPVLIFSFYATQLPHYIMPGFPALFLMLFQSDRLPEKRGVERVFYWVVMGLWAVIIGTLAYGIFGVEWSGRLVLLRQALMGVAAALVGYWLLAIFARYQLKQVLGFGLLLIVIGATMAGAFLKFSVATRQLALLWHNLEPQGQTVGWGYSEPGLVFYSQRLWDFYDDEERPLSELLEQEGTQTVLARVREWRLDDPTFKAVLAGETAAPWRDRSEAIAAAEAQADRLGFETLRLTGFNYARSSWVELAVFVRPEGLTDQARQAITQPAAPAAE
ncbi:MAG: glycosyl transferase family protein [Puniceicoccaceae bacterium 5H]|nr:MAG: glycosyl transferase family protein [Puniceicoccaceae bacterium 5H]